MNTHKQWRFSYRRLGLLWSKHIHSWHFRQAMVKTKQPIKLAYIIHAIWLSINEPLHWELQNINPNSNQWQSSPWAVLLHSNAQKQTNMNIEYNVSLFLVLPVTQSTDIKIGTNTSFYHNLLEESTCTIMEKSTLVSKPTATSRSEISAHGCWHTLQKPWKNTHHSRVITLL